MFAKKKILTHDKLSNNGSKNKRETDTARERLKRYKRRVRKQSKELSLNINS